MTESPARFAQAGVRRCLAAAICMTERGATSGRRVLAAQGRPGLRIEPGVEGDVDRAQGLAQRAVFFRRGSQLLELVCVETRCRDGRRQFDAGYVDAVPGLVQVNARAGVD